MIKKKKYQKNCLKTQLIGKMKEEFKRFEDFLIRTWIKIYYFYCLNGLFRASQGRYISLSLTEDLDVFKR